MIMSHLLAILPYKKFEETFQSVLSAIEKSNLDISVISRLKKEDFKDYPFIKNTIYIEDEELLSENDNEFFQILDEFYKENPFTAVINYFETYVELAAKITEKYGLQGNSSKTAIATRNKHIMREILQQNNINVPKFVMVTSFEQYLEAIKLVGFPCISKPISGSASEGVFKIDTDSNLKNIYDFSSTQNIKTNPDYKNEILVETYIEGPEISVEAVVSNEEIYIMGITEKTTEKEPYFNEVMHIHPALLPKETEAEIHDLTKRTIKALEIKSGGVHLEARISKNGIYVQNS